MPAGRVFVGNTNANFYSLDLKTGCTYWTYKAETGVRTASACARDHRRRAAHGGDVRRPAGQYLRLDAQTGAEIWKRKVDDARRRQNHGRADLP